MKVLASVCVVGLLFGVGVAWWASTSGPKAAAARSDERTAGVYFNKSGNGGDDRIARSVDRQLRGTWVPTDAERIDDDGAYLRWVPTDAERPDDNGAYLTWVPTDAERIDDDGAYLTWVATDAERDDDVGILIPWLATSAVSRR